MQRVMSVLIRARLPPLAIHFPFQPAAAPAASTSLLQFTSLFASFSPGASFRYFAADAQLQPADNGEEAFRPEQRVVSQQNFVQTLPTPQPEFPFNAKAYYIGSKLDISALHERQEFVTLPNSVYRDSTVLQLAPLQGKPASSTTPTGSQRTFLVAYKYGSIVIFNAGDSEERVVEICKQHAEKPAQKVYIEELRITYRPGMPSWSMWKLDHLQLQQLDFNNLRTISHVMGQSVALDCYARNVEQMLEVFCTMNLEMQKTGNFASIGKQHLLQMVAENNIILTDVIAKLGLWERFDIAWKFNQYGEIYEHLRDELEINNRFRVLEMKLTMMQDNLKYFLEIMQNKKSDTLEWTIIILIAAEIFVSCYDMWTKSIGIAPH